MGMLPKGPYKVAIFLLTGLLTSVHRIKDEPDFHMGWPRMFTDHKYLSPLPGRLLLNHLGKKASGGSLTQTRPLLPATVCLRTQTSGNMKKPMGPTFAAAFRTSNEESANVLANTVLAQAPRCTALNMPPR